MTSPDEELLAELLLQWEELFEHGQETPASVLASDRPDLVVELARRIEIMKATGWMDEPDDDPSDDDVPPPPPSHAPRTLKGRYRLDDLVAEGGFAQVFRGYDTELQRTVAVKMPKPGRLASTDAFQAEARRVARLKHECIVPVFDVGMDGNTCFIVSAYIQEGNMADRLAARLISPDDAIRCITEIAGALEYAHLHGVIHRDVKPANILIDHHGKAHLADFGIALSPTKTGDFAPSVGTLRYMAPEQLSGDSADHRSDIYSLAVVLHEALTGKLPYSSDKPSVLQREITAGGVKVSSTLRPPVAKVVTKALSKSPHARHASAAAFAADLNTAWSDRSRGTSVTDRVGMPWLLGVGAVVVIGALAGPIVFGLLPPAKREPETQKQTLPPKKPVADTKPVPIPPANEAFSLRARAMTLAKSRDFTRAISDLERAIELMPASKDLHEDLATVFAIRSHERFYQGDFEGSRKDMDEAILHAPGSAVNYKRRAACWFQLGDYEKALADMTEAVERNPQNSEFYELRASALRKLGREDEADTDDRKAKELSR